MIDYGGLVFLSPLDFTYSDTLFRWRNDYRIRRYTRQNDLLTWAEHDEWIKRVGNSPVDKMYLVRRKSSQTVVGVAGLTGLDLINRRAEFSLYIGPEFHKNGYGKDALKTLVSHGFNTFGLESIWGESFAFNKAQDMFKAIGFCCDGIRRKFYFREGTPVDSILYSILRTDWQDSRHFEDFRGQKCSS